LHSLEIESGHLKTGTIDLKIISKLLKIKKREMNYGQEDIDLFLSEIEIKSTFFQIHSTKLKVYYYSKVPILE